MGVLEYVGAILAAVIAAFVYGRKKGKDAERERLDREYRETRDRMDAVDISDDDATEWLHERSQQRGGM